MVKVLKSVPEEFALVDGVMHVKQTPNNCTSTENTKEPSNSSRTNNKTIHNSVTITAMKSTGDKVAPADLVTDRHTERAARFSHVYNGSPPTQHRGWQACATHMHDDDQQERRESLSRKGFKFASICRRRATIIIGY